MGRMSRVLLQQALDGLKELADEYYGRNDKLNILIQNIEQELAKPKPDPIARTNQKELEKPKQMSVGAFAVDDGKTISDVVYYETGMPDGNYLLYTSTPQQKPLTPSDWWDIAPWNYDMDSVPKDGTKVLLKDCNGYLVETWWLVEYHSYSSLSNTTLSTMISWLPLPENK